MPFRRQNENIETFSPFRIIDGLSYGTWTARWWNWALSGPKDTNPVMDPEGRYAARGQNAPTWFLAGTFGEDKCPKRLCKIPFDNHILFPVINYEANFLEDPYIKNEEELANHVDKDMDDIVIRKAIIDEIEVPVFRVKSDPLVFGITIEENNPRGISAGHTRIASDGYWVFVKSLPYGSHTVHFRGACAGGIRNSMAYYEIEII